MSLPNNTKHSMESLKRQNEAIAEKHQLNLTDREHDIRLKC